MTITTNKNNTTPQVNDHAAHHNEIATVVNDHTDRLLLVEDALPGKQDANSDLAAIAALSTTAFGRSLLESADAAAARTLTGAQQADAELTALAGLTSAADKLPYFSDSGAAALTNFTAFSRTLLDASNAVTARATLVTAGLADANVFTATQKIQVASALKLDLWNTTIQVAALRSDNENNIGVGKDALLSNTVTGSGSEGLYNTALGYGALRSNTTGASNVAAGAQALFLNTTGASNVAAGYRALYSPAGTAGNATTTGLRQTAVGTETGQASPTQRNDIVALGYRALVDANDTVALGSGAQALHSGAVALGKGTVTTAIDQVMVAARHVAFSELAADPNAAAVNGGRLYLKDNGAGKTQLCVRFNTGAVQVIATEP